MQQVFSEAEAAPVATLALCHSLAEEGNSGYGESHWVPRPVSLDEFCDRAARVFFFFFFFAQFFFFLV
jgi:hypothetical protein